MRCVILFGSKAYSLRTVFFRWINTYDVINPRSRGSSSAVCAVEGGQRARDGLFCGTRPRRGIALRATHYVIRSYIQERALRVNTKC